MTKPVFIIGSPRSGTTLALELLSVHDCFAWVSNKLNQRPHDLKYALFNRIYEDPNLGKPLLLKRRGSRTLPYPVEPWKFWNSYLSNFQWERGGPIPPRRRNEHDMSLAEAKSIRLVVDDICRYQNKERFLSKYTDFPRIKYLTQAFPDAMFIHIVRDGRAVAYSYYDKILAGSWLTWEERDWWIRGWPESWRREWREKYNNPLGFVAYMWKFFVHEIWEDAKFIPLEQFIEINYRNLVESTKTVLENIFQLCGLKMSSQVEWYLSHLSVCNMNYKWRKNLSAQQRKDLETITAEGRFKRLLDR